MQGTVMAIGLENVLGACARMKAEGYRFVTMTCSFLGGEALELLYHFDKDFQMTHLRLGIAKDTLLPSVSGVFRAAFLVENEIQDLFGLRFAGLEPDYHQTLYLDPEAGQAPFCQYTVQEKGSSRPDGFSGSPGT